MFTSSSGTPGETSGGTSGALNGQQVRERLEYPVNSSNGFDEVLRADSAKVARTDTDEMFIGESQMFSEEVQPPRHYVVLVELDAWTAKTTRERIARDGGADAAHVVVMSLLEFVLLGSHLFATMPWDGVLKPQVDLLSDQHKKVVKPLLKPAAMYPAYHQGWL